MLHNLKINNYRCFKDFETDGLARVNLIVGENSIGKTNLLEAIYLLVSSQVERGQESLQEIFSWRGDALVDSSSQEFPFFARPRVLYFVNDIFYGWDKERQISISSRLDTNEVRLEIIVSLKSADSPRRLMFWVWTNLANGGGSPLPGSANIIGDRLIAARETRSLEIHPYLFVPLQRYQREQLASLWDRITLTPKEDKLLEVLRLINPDIQGIRFTVGGNSHAILVKMKDREYPVPLSSLGEGMYRLLTIAMTMVMAENGVLLVDEIDIGLYYEVQPNMWRLIVQTAKELNIQVFATTHSWDCVDAFEAAASETDGDCKLFRLDKKYGEIRAVEYTREDLEVAIEQGIEVR